MQTNHLQRHHAVPLLSHHEVPLLAKGGAALWQGSIGFREIATGLAVPGADVANIKFVGVVLKGLDNTAGADGLWRGRMGNERFVVVNSSGVISLPIIGPEPVPGQSAYVVDNEIVTATPTTQGHVMGVFQRPCEFKANQWQVRYQVNA